LPSLSHSLAVVGAFALSLGVCPSSLAQPLVGEHESGMEVAAIVEGEVITTFELHRYCLLTRTEEYFPVRDEPSPRREQIRREELEVLIREKVLEHKARADEIELTDADEQRIRFEIQRIADRYRGQTGLEEALAELGVPWEFFLDLRRRNLLIQKLTLRSISREIFVGPEQVRLYYQEHRGQWETRGEVRFRMLTVFPDPQRCARQNPLPPLVAERVEAGDFDAHLFAAELRARVLNGEDFVELAERGGMGWVWNNDQVYEHGQDLSRVLNPPALADVVAGLEVGEVSEVFETERGTLYLVFLIDRRAPGALSLSQVQEEIESAVRNGVWRERVQTWQEEAVEAAEVQRCLPEGQ
jgi:SurA N-terminal domain/PPIC-type PPIASE domain